MTDESCLSTSNCSSITSTPVKKNDADSSGAEESPPNVLV